MIKTVPSAYMAIRNEMREKESAIQAAISLERMRRRDALLKKLEAVWQIASRYNGCVLDGLFVTASKKDGVERPHVAFACDGKPWFSIEAAGHVEESRLISREDRFVTSAWVRGTRGANLQATIHDEEVKIVDDAPPETNEREFAQLMIRQVDFEIRRRQSAGEAP